LILVGVVAALAVAGLFSAHPIRAQLALGISLLGLTTAVMATGFQVAFAGGEAVPVWAGAGLSLMWLGLVVAAATGMSVLRKFSFYPAIAGIAAVSLLALPLLAAMNVGSSDVAASNGKTLPAYVVAQAQLDPKIGTLVLTPQPNGGLGAIITRGSGPTLESISTLATTRVTFSESDVRLATLVGDLASNSGDGTTAELTDLGIGFIVLTPAQAALDSPISSAAQATAAKTTTALDSNAAMDSIGVTDVGMLWRFAAATGDAPGAQMPNSATEPLRALILGSQALVIILTLLLAIPTGAPRRDIGLRRRVAGLAPTAVSNDVDLPPLDGADPLAGELDDEQN
jgi:hypothetical protein